MPARYLTPPSPLPPPADAEAELVASLTRINAFNPPVQTCSTGWHHAGLYTGPSSVALLFYRLSQLYPDMTFKGQHLSDWATAYLELGQSYLPGRSKRARVDADHCGVANETLCQLALRACLEHDASLAHALCAYANSLLAPSATGGSDEWLYGRAGYLYLLRLVRASFGSGPCSHEIPVLDTVNRTIDLTINRTIDLTINRILATATASHPWQWHGTAYVGAVHGAIGILTQVVLASRRDQPLASHVTAKIEAMLQATMASVQQQSPFLPASLQAAIASAIERAQPDILARGLLTKDPCLCHGVPTNAFALACDAQFERYLALTASAQLEANGAWMGKAGGSSDFVGLYTGEAGRAWMWAVADQMQRRGNGKTRWDMGIIGFSDL
ncbi:hypothetical protein DV737_g5483, partial [Chaetothyriales sp. CBS 132003]